MFLEVNLRVCGDDESKNLDSRASARSSLTRSSLFVILARPFLKAAVDFLRGGGLGGPIEPEPEPDMVGGFQLREGE